MTQTYNLNAYLPKQQNSIELLFEMRSLITSSNHFLFRSTLFPLPVLSPFPTTSFTRPLSHFESRMYPTPMTTCSVGNHLRDPLLTNVQVVIFSSDCSSASSASSPCGAPRDQELLPSIYSAGLHHASDLNQSTNDGGSHLVQPALKQQQPHTIFEGRRCVHAASQKAIGRNHIYMHDRDDVCTNLS